MSDFIISACLHNFRTHQGVLILLMLKRSMYMCLISLLRQKCFDQFLPLGCMSSPCNTSVLAKGFPLIVHQLWTQPVILKWLFYPINYLGFLKQRERTEEEHSSKYYNPEKTSKCICEIVATVTHAFVIYQCYLLIVTAYEYPSIKEWYLSIKPTLILLMQVWTLCTTDLFSFLVFTCGSLFKMKIHLAINGII